MSEVAVECVIDDHPNVQTSPGRWFAQLATQTSTTFPHAWSFVRLSAIPIWPICFLAGLTYHSQHHSTLQEFSVAAQVVLQEDHLSGVPLNLFIQFLLRAFLVDQNRLLGARN